MPDRPSLVALETIGRVSGILFPWNRWQSAREAILCVW